MAKLFQTYWYNEQQAVRNAFLFNLRDDDLRSGGRVRRGEIVAGKCGYAIAEADVFGLSGRIVPFAPNRQCEWQGHILHCMALDGLPQGPVSRAHAGGLRHKHCVVVEFTSKKALEDARAAGLPVVHGTDGKTYANLEVAHIPQRQKRYRRATLL
jgi:hypothetical protein